MAHVRAAIVLGASGSVGSALVAALLADGTFEPVVTLTRRALPALQALGQAAPRPVRECLVPDMTPAALHAATLAAIAAIEPDREVEAFSVLGIGAGTGKLSLADHRAVDVALNEAFARAARDSGRVRHLGLMTAVGADPTAKETGSGAAGGARYNRVKGEAEAAVRAHGPALVSVFRPAMIIGSQHTPWLLEKTLPCFGLITPGKYRSIRTTEIAEAMVAAAKDHPPASAVHHYPEMKALIARGRQGAR